MNFLLLLVLCDFFFKQDEDLNNFWNHVFGLTALTWCSSSFPETSSICDEPWTWDICSMTQSFIGLSREIPRFDCFLCPKYIYAIKLQLHSGFYYSVLLSFQILLFLGWVAKWYLVLWTSCHFCSKAIWWIFQLSKFSLLRKAASLWGYGLRSCWMFQTLPWNVWDSAKKELRLLKQKWGTTWCLLLVLWKFWDPFLQLEIFKHIKIILQWENQLHYNPDTYWHMSYKDVLY